MGLTQEMMTHNVIQWLDDIAAGVKATQKRVVARMPKYDSEYEWRCEVSTTEITSVLVNRLENLFNILGVTPSYCFRKYGSIDNHGNYEYVAQYIVYKDVYFFDLLNPAEYENEREQNENLKPFEELPVLNF